MPIGAIAAAALPVLGSVADTLINNEQTANLNRSNRKFQVEQWNRTNAYNTPLEQRKRMEAAGFNPNLMYGHGSVANVASNQSLPSSVVPPKPNLGAAAEASMRMGADLALKREQSENANIQNEYWKAMTEKTWNDSFLSSAKFLTEMSEAEKRNFDNSKLAEMFNANMDALKEKTRLSSLQGDNLEVQTKIASMNLDWLPAEKRRDAQLDMARLANLSKDLVVKDSLVRLQGLSGEKLKQEVENLKVSKRGAELDNMVKQMSALKAEYGLGNDAVSNLLGIPVKLVDDLLSAFGINTDKHKKVYK